MAIKRTGFAAEGAKTVYNRLASDRLQYQTRAEDNAKLTIPALFPKDGDNGSTKYDTPYQSVGARGLNNLSSKLMLALFPQQAWMKLNISEWLEKQMIGDPSLREKSVAALAMIERILMNFMEGNSYKTVLLECLKQLNVAGNALLVLPEPTELYTPPKLYKLYSYVVERDAYGNVLQIVTKDVIAYAALPEDVRSTLDPNHSPNDKIELYTHVYLNEETGQYDKYEEVDGNEIDGTDASYPRDAVPFIAVRMIRQDGENYGRSYVEEYMGDLSSLEKLQTAIINASMIASKVVGLVNPTGLTQPRRVVNAQTGDFIPGRLQDIEFLQVQKSQDLSIAKATSDELTSRLSYAFMLNSAIQRNGDRVTAEEIRYVAQELEDTLGGVYSVLTQELQLPLVRVLLSQLQATKKVPELPKEAITPSVVTGLDAIGRGQDKNRLMEFANGLGGMGALMQNPDVNGSVLLLRWANATGVDTDGILYTQEEKAQKLAENVVQTGAENFGGTLGAGAAAAATSSPEAMQAAADNAGLQPTEINQG